MQINLVGCGWEYVIITPVTYDEEKRFCKFGGAMCIGRVCKLQGVSSEAYASMGIAGRKGDGTGSAKPCR